MRETHIARGKEAEIEVLGDDHSHQIQHSGQSIQISTETEIRVTGISVLIIRRVTNTSTLGSRTLQGLPIRHRVLSTPKSPRLKHPIISINNPTGSATRPQLVRSNEGALGAHRLQIPNEVGPSTSDLAEVVTDPRLEIAGEGSFLLPENPETTPLVRDPGHPR